jgi:hypothetical protein
MASKHLTHMVLQVVTMTQRMEAGAAFEAGVSTYVKPLQCTSPEQEQTNKKIKSSKLHQKRSKTHTLSHTYIYTNIYTYACICTHKHA